MGPYAGVDYNSPYLTVNPVVINPSPPQKGVEWERSLLLVEHSGICMLISKTPNMKRERGGRGDGRGES
jgi:hypothetical protein